MDFEAILRACVADKLPAATPLAPNETLDPDSLPIYFEAAGKVYTYSWPGSDNRDPALRTAITRIELAFAAGTGHTVSLMVRFKTT